MAMIPLAEVAVDSRCGEDVRLPDGRVLIPAGTVVSARHLAACRTWGIRSLSIVDADDGRTLSPDPDQLRRQATELIGLFRNVDRRGAFAAELLRLCALRRVRRDRHAEP